MKITDLFSLRGAGTWQIMGVGGQTERMNGFVVRVSMRSPQFGWVLIADKYLSNFAL